MSAIDQALKDLRLELQRHALTPSDIDALFCNEKTLHGMGIRADSIEPLRQIAREALSGEKSPEDLRLFEKLLKILGRALDLPIRGRTSFHPLTIAMRHARVVVGGILSVLVLYMLCGGLCVSYPSTWILRVLGLFALLGLLGVYEGLQISTALLRLKDLYGLRESYPRSYRLHQLFNSEEGLRKFFAGRQFFVVVIVFLAAQLTAVPTPEELPWLGIRTPEWFKHSIGLVFWDFGMAGALFTLWVGQLAPQFIANRSPLWFLENPGMTTALRLAIMLEDIGITAPGSWLAKAVVRPEERIPASAREAFRQCVEEIHGCGLVGVKKHWSISRNAAVLIYKVAGTFRWGGQDSWVDDGLYVQGTGFKPRFSGQILSEDGTLRTLGYVQTEVDRDEGVTQFRHVVAPHVGGFQRGDTLLLETRVEFGSQVGADVVIVERPTKYVNFQVEFEEEPAELSRVVVQTSVPDPATGQRKSAAEWELQIRQEGQRTFCDFIDFYPEVGTQYALRWQYRY